MVIHLHTHQSTKCIAYSIIMVCAIMERSEKRRREKCNCIKCNAQEKTQKQAWRQGVERLGGPFERVGRTVEQKGRKQRPDDGRVYSLVAEGCTERDC